MHKYHGADEQYWGPQKMTVPGPAWDDVFHHVWVLRRVPGTLTIRRFADDNEGVLLPAQDRTDGHVRALVAGDAPFPPVTNEPDIAKMQQSKEEKTAQPAETLGEVDYASYVASLDLSSRKKRMAIRGTSFPNKITKWHVLTAQPGVSSFSGFDNMPLARELGDVVTEVDANVKVAAPGLMWDFRMSGVSAKMCCLAGFQVNRGPFFINMIAADYVEKHVDRAAVPMLLLENCVKMLVTDLFAHGTPAAKVNMSVLKAGERLCEQFLQTFSTRPDVWAELRLVQTAEREAEIKEELRRQQVHSKEMQARRQARLKKDKERAAKKEADKQKRLAVVKKLAAERRKEARQKVCLTRCLNPDTNPYTNTNNRPRWQRSAPISGKPLKP